MNKILLHCLAMLIAVGGTAAQTAAADARDSAVRPTKVIRLFDGKSLGDSYTWMKDTQREDPRKVFRVTDGMLHVTGDGLGGLVTNKEYRDYHCILEIKWGPRTWAHRKERTKDSGLLIHSVGADGGYNQRIWMPSIEAQIIEGGFGDFILVRGDDKDGKPVPLALTSERRAIATAKSSGKRAAGAKRSICKTANGSTGTAAIPIGKTCSASAASTTSKAPTASGRGWTSSATAATSRSS